MILWPGMANAGSPYELSDGIEALVKQLLKNRDAIEGRRVAVTDLSPLNGDLGHLGASLSEGIFDTLGRRGVRLVERSLLQGALEEMRLNMTDLVGVEEHKKRFGRLTGAEILLVGTVTDLGESLKINARMIEVETSAIIAAGHVAIQKNKNILKQMGVPIPGSLVIETTSGSEVYLDNELIGKTNWRGHLRVDSIEPGVYTLKIVQDGYRPLVQSIEIREDMDQRVEAALVKLPSPMAAAALSFLVPGAGDLYLGNADWWIYPVAVGGAIYGAYAYSKKTEELILVDDDKGGQRLEKRGKDPVYLFAGLAATIWIYDIFHVYQSGVNQRNAQMVFTVEPESRGAQLVYRWTWP